MSEDPTSYPTESDVVLEQDLFEPLGTSQTARSPEARAKWEREISKTPRQREPEKGWTVSVPTQGVVEGTVPSVEHYPYVWIDIYTGESLNKTRDPLGLAQQYGSGRLPDAVMNSKDFIRLADIQGLRVRLSTTAGSPGTCTISLQNALVGRERKDGTWYWQRKHFKPSRFTDGQQIRYLDRFPSLLGSRRMWYRGKLKVVETRALADVVLDGKPFRVVWEDGQRPAGALGFDFTAGLLERVINEDGEETWSTTSKGSRVREVLRLDPSCVFAETASEPLFEPMHKIKIFGMNRFPPARLKGFPYKPYTGPGGEKSGDDEGHQIVQTSPPPGEKSPRFRPRQTTITGEPIKERDMLQYTGEAAFHYATPIFTGYVNDVSSKQEGANWTVTVTARDVSCWLDYSQLNVSPSINIWGADLIREVEQQNWQVYTTRFETMPAHEIARALYLGLHIAYVTATETITDFDLLQAQTLFPMHMQLRRQAIQSGSALGAYVYSYPDPDKRPRFRIIGENSRPLVLQKSSRVYIRGQHPTDSNDPDWYYVATGTGRLGWMQVSDLSAPQSTYDALEHFIETDDPTTRLVPIGLSTKDIKDMFAADRLIINPSIEPGTDDYVTGAYETYMRQNWPLIQSEYVSRRSILNQVVKHSNCECYADGDGRVWFHPVRAYHSVSDPVYIIHPEDTLSWAFTFSDKEIVTWAHVHGEYAFGTIPGEWLYGQITEGDNMLKRFGVRAIHVSNPNIKTREAARTYARSILKRVNANKVTGAITLVFRPEMQLARNVFVPWLNVVGYIANIEHNVQWGRTATSTVSLKYVRHPWEPWSPIEYNPTAQDDAIRAATSKQNPDRGRKKTSKETAIYPSKYKVIVEKNLFAPLQAPDASEGKQKMRDYVLEAYREAAISIHKNLGVRCSVTKGRDSAGSEIWKRGTALKVELDKMDQPNIPGTGYLKVAGEINLAMIITTFRGAGFRVINKYRTKSRWEEGDTRGHLVLIYSNPPPSDIVPEDEL